MSLLRSISKKYSAVQPVIVHQTNSAQTCEGEDGEDGEGEDGGQEAEVAGEQESDVAT